MTSCSGMPPPGNSFKLFQIISIGIIRMSEIS